MAVGDAFWECPLCRKRCEINERGGQRYCQDVSFAGLLESHLSGDQHRWKALRQTCREFKSSSNHREQLELLLQHTERNAELFNGADESSLTPDAAKSILTLQRSKAKRDVGSDGRGIAHMLCVRGARVFSNSLHVQKVAGAFAMYESVASLGTMEQTRAWLTRQYIFTIAKRTREEGSQEGSKGGWSRWALCQDEVLAGLDSIGYEGPRAWPTSVAST